MREVKSVCKIFILKIFVLQLRLLGAVNNRFMNNLYSPLTTLAAGVPVAVASGACGRLLS